MAITAASMMGKIKANIAACSASQGSDPAAAQTHRDAVLLAMCQGIVDEIHQNATVPVPGIQAGGATATGSVL
jgi:hypothetical protein